MKLEHAARQALEALEYLPEMRGIDEAIIALREALSEQAEQEPVAWIDNKTWCFTYSQYEYEDLDDDMKDDLVPLYAAPIRTKDLTPHEITALIREGAADGGWQGFAQRVIAADREKNK